MRLLRPAVGLSAAALLLLPALAQAVQAPAVPAVPAAAALPTSWPAVPVADRLQPWLAQELATTTADRLRVMVSGETIAAATGAAKASGMTVQQTWRSSGIVVAIGSPEQVRDVVTQPGVRAVEGDQPITFQLDTAHTATRSDVAESTIKAADGSRLGGAGSSVAIIDSGIDGRHPFFQRDGKSTVVRNLKNVCTALSGPTDTCFQQDPTNDTDTTAVGGHGTHVAGITGGVDTTLSDGTRLRGSAPDVNLVGLSVGATLSIINANAAMQWVLDHHRQPCKPITQQEGPADPACPPIKATNHSYGPASVPAGGHTFNPSNPTVTIQRNLVKAGVTVVWAAGNSAGDGTIATTNPPGMDPTPGVLMVASYNDAGTGTRDNQLSTFSSRGAKGKAETYPDLSAPGDGITSACRPYLAICATGLDFRNGPGATDIGTFNTISGTSMATPYVAATAALVTDITGGTLTTEQFERRLTASAWDLGAAGWDQEFGYGLANPHRTLCSFTTCGATVTPTPTASPTPTPTPTPTASPTTSPTPSATAAPSPTKTISPSPSQSPSQPTSPSQSPSPSPEPPEDTDAQRSDVRLGFTTSGGTVRRGGSVLIALRATDADTGDPVAGQRVVVRGWRQGVIRLRERVTTDAEGNASVRIRLYRTTRFDLRSPATDTTRVSMSPTSIRWRIR